MLPGLRILLAITLLSVSVLIFGLGAAAYLRSAHEHFASAPWRPIETPVTARGDLAPPMLAMLRVEPEPAPASPAPATDLPTATSAPAEIMRHADEAIAAPVAVDATSPRADPSHTTAKLATPEPPAPARLPLQADAPRTPSEPVTAARIFPETPPRDTPMVPAIAEAKVAEIREAPPAPTIVAALNPEKTETQTKTATEPVAVAAPPAAAPPPDVTAPTATVTGADTLKADDKTIDVTPPAKTAALSEPVAADVALLRPNEVKIPNPRLDPAVIEARRQRNLANQRARARAQARRVAAARARAAQQARSATAASNPFGTPAGSSSITAN